MPRRFPAHAHRAPSPGHAPPTSLRGSPTGPGRGPAPDSAREVRAAGERVRSLPGTPPRDRCASRRSRSAVARRPRASACPGCATPRSTSRRRRTRRPTGRAWPARRRAGRAARHGPGPHRRGHEAQRTSVLGDRLTAGGECRRPVAGAPGIADDGVRVESALGVVRQPGVVGSGALELGEDAAVDPGTGVRADLLLDRAAGDLVTEPQHRTVADQKPRRDRLVEALAGASRHHLQERRLDALADERRSVEYLATGGGSWTARARTASRAECGSSWPLARRTSVTKNGLPPVSW